MTKRNKSLVKNILFSKKNKYRKTKKIFGFLCGLFMGLCLYEMILIDLKFINWVTYIVALLISLMLAFGLAYSTQIRCIIILSVSTFLGKTGRGVLLTLILSFIISGPVENLTENGKEVIRVFACATSLTFNLTKTRFELMFKPFTQALFGIKTEVNEVKDTLRSVRDLSAPLVGEIESDKEMKKLKEENDYLDNIQGDSLRSDDINNKHLTKGEQIEAAKFEKLYIEKVELRCNKQFSTAAFRCRKMFSSAYDKCYDAVSWVAAWILCWPMKLDFVCNIAQALGGSSRCDPSGVIDPGLGTGYDYLKNSKNVLNNNFKNVRLQYKLQKITQLIDLNDATDSSKAILHDVEAKKKLIDKLLLFLKRILAFVFLYIFVKSQNYHNQYLRDIEFDNFYITKYFRKIDARRKAAEKTVLFPLKKFERLKLIDYYSRRYLKNEKENLVSEIFKLFLEIMFASTFILIDRLFYEVLDLVKRHAKIEYTQIGHHDLLLEIKGTGMIASLLRSIVKGFNIKKRIKIVQSNEHCLPNPSLMSNYFFLKIYGTFFCLFLMTIFQMYTNRLRSVMCSYFYRKRQKKRILYLYNETLRKRRGFLRYMKTKISRKVRERRLEENANACLVLRTKYPNKCGFLKIFGMARRDCIICEEHEGLFDSIDRFEICKTEGCHLIYCKECWLDVGNECLACSIIETDSSGFEDETEYEED